MKHYAFLLIAIITLVIINGCTSSQPVEFIDLKKETGLHKPYFVDFKINKEYDNPFLQEDIKVDAFFVNPSKDTMVLPCFYKKNMEKENFWQARFMPKQEGIYKLWIQVKQDGQISNSLSKSFVTKKTDAKGQLSLNPDNPWFLQFDNGEQFRGVGMNVGWDYEPKWDTERKYTFEMFFDELEANHANFIRMWICPWNFPIEWSPVKTYEMLTDDFSDWTHTKTHSNSLKINKGKTPVTQNDKDQLIKTSSKDQSLVYQLDSVRSVKIKLYYKGEINKEDIAIYYSSDGNNYEAAVTEFSDSWESARQWRRIFLYTFDSIPQPANYIKVILRENIREDNIKLAGIQFKYGKVLSQLDADLGKYSAKNSSKLDQLIDMADSKGIHMMLTLGYHSEFNPVMDVWGSNDEWQRNPYNSKNGGPCDKPADFFTNSTAKEYYKNYLRYFVARWGYSPVITAWEFWNEINIAENSQNIPRKAIVSWHKEMATYLKSIDPYNHIITTSLSHGEYPKLWNIEDIDLTHIHRYAPTKGFVEKTMDFIKKYDKPHIIGEYAVGWQGPGNDYSDERYEEEFHDGMWRGMFTPVPILPLSWWWDYHYDQNQYFHFKPLARVIKEMKATSSDFSQLAFPEKKGFDIFGIQNSGLTLVWINKNDSPSSLSLNIPVKSTNNYKIQKLNTWDNEIMEETVMTPDNGKLNIANINLAGQKDIALLISQQE